MHKKILICQSCAMPMKTNDDYGTNEDNSKNNEYCKFCYNNGKFTDEGITLEDKIKKNITIAKKMGMDEKKASELANNTLPKLKRWIKN